jgi:hypothetical protein
MKKLLFSISFLAVTCIILVSCDKNGFTLKENVFIEGKASLKVNYLTPTQARPTYQIKLDGVRISNNLIYPTPFPGGGLNTGGGNYADYLAANPGQRKIDISIPKVGTNEDSVQLASATVTLDANKSYSLYFCDTAANLSSFMLEDDLNSPDSGFTKFRFINLMPDVAAGIDLYFGTGSTSTTSTKVQGPIAYKGVSPYFLIPLNTGTVWSIRPGGAAATTTALATYTSASTVVNQRVFTAIARGYSTISTPTTDGRLRAISFIYNR